MTTPQKPKPLTAQLLVLARAYCKARDLSMARISTLIFNDGKKFALIEGGADLGTGKWESAVQWFSDNWPDDLAWPAGINHPAKKAA